MGTLDEILKSYGKVLQWLRRIYRVTNSGFDTKIRLETSGFQWTWSGLNEIEAVNISGFSGVWGRLDTLSGQLARKITIELSGFQNTWSGLNELEAVNSSGFDNLSGLLEEEIRVKRSGFIGDWNRLDTLSGQLARKINIEISGFQDTWSGLNDVEADIVTVQDINRSGFTGSWGRLDTLSGLLEEKIRVETSGFQNIQSGLVCANKGTNGYFMVSGVALSGAVMASGVSTDAVAVNDYNDKTFYWESADSLGTMLVEVSDPNGNWHQYDTVAFTSGNLVWYIMTGQAISVRLSNAALMSGTIEAWYVMRCQT